MNITNVKEILERKFRGVSLDDVEGISDYSLFKEAAVNVLAETDPLETIQNDEISLYHEVYDYTSPTSLKDTKVLDIRPQVNRGRNEYFGQRFIEDFDREKKNKDFSVEYDGGTKFIRVSRNLGNSSRLHNLDSTTSNGTWTAAGGASALIADTIYHAEGNASLRFSIGAMGGYIENSALTAVDLDDHDEKSSLFVWVYFPDASIITNVILRWGSSDSAYWSRTVTAPHFGSFRNGWNLLRFDWNGAMETGTVDPAAIDYLRVTITSTAVDTDLRVDAIYSRLPVIHEIVYYSRYLFRNTSGTFLETPSADSDNVNLETSADNLFIEECCLLVSSGLQRWDDYNGHFGKLYGSGQDVGLYAKYKASKPGQAIRPHHSYYDGGRRSSRFDTRFDTRSQ